MKKTYQRPATDITVCCQEALLRANSIDHTGNGSDVQQGIEDNDDDDFEAGAKGNGFTPWDRWDD